jgi:1L-myo-inositol 1-phosphate cytidylyltransferase
MTRPSGSTSLSRQASITEAVILMAGTGSRLRGSDETLLKPLIPLLGRPLISYTFDAMAKAGIKRINAVIGFEGERLSAGVKPLVPPGLEIRFIKNNEWQKQNGISLLAAANYMTAPFILAMSDHLFDDAILQCLIKPTDPHCLSLAIDTKIDSIFDLDDAMKIQTRGDHVTAIGKNLTSYDAIDTGLFVCPLEIFKYLERTKQNDDCSLADGVRLMAKEGKVRAINIGGAWWQDIDTPAMLARAEEHLAGQGLRHPSATKSDIYSCNTGDR